MVNMRAFCFSHPLFWGFKRYIDLDEVDSKEEIITQMSNYLITFLKDENLEVLLEKFKTDGLHIHNHSFENILLSQPEEVFYICDHKD